MCIQDPITYLASNRNPKVQCMIYQLQNGPDSYVLDRISFPIDPYTVESLNMIQYTTTCQYF